MRFTFHSWTLSQAPCFPYMGGPHPIRIEQKADLPGADCLRTPTAAPSQGFSLPAGLARPAQL